MSAAPMIVALEVDIASSDAFERSRSALAELLAIGSMLKLEKVLASRPEVAFIEISRSAHSDFGALVIPHIWLSDGSSMPARDAANALLDQERIERPGMDPREPSDQRGEADVLETPTQERLNSLDFEMEREVDEIFHDMEAANRAQLIKIRLPATLRQGFSGARIAQELGLADLASHMERLALGAQVAHRASFGKKASL